MGNPQRTAHRGMFRDRSLEDIRSIHDRETDLARRATLRVRARLQSARAGLTPPAWSLNSRNPRG